MSDLKPCPFCGTQPTLPSGDGTQYEILCEDCGGAVASVQICDLMTLEERASDSFKDYRYGEEFVERAKIEAIGRWNTRAPAEDVRAVGEEPVILRHMAVAENGVLRWMTGRKMQDCELYALPSGGAIRDKLYRHPQRPVVLPERYDESQYRGTSLLAVRRWNACIDEFERLNKC